MDKEFATTDLLAGLRWSELRKVVVRPKSLNEDEWPASLPLTTKSPGASGWLSWLRRSSMEPRLEAVAIRLKSLVNCELKAFDHR